jgi:hypothetical protein
VQDSRLVRGIQNKLVGSPGDIPQPRGGSQPVFGSEARTISSVSRDILAFSSPKKRRITYNLHKHKIKELLSLIKSAADAATSKENQENLYPNLLKFIVLYNDKISTKAALFLIQKIKMSLNVDQLALLRKEFKERAAFLNPIRPNEAAFLMRCFENLTN